MRQTKATDFGTQLLRSLSAISPLPYTPLPPNVTNAPRLSPYFTIEVDGKNVGSLLVLDVTAGQGSSGSPVFLLDTGEVCGILTQAKLRHVVGAGGDDDSETRVPLGIAEAEPVTMVKAWLRENGPKPGS